MAGIHVDCWGHIKDILKMMNLFTDRLIFFARKQISGWGRKFLCHSGRFNLCRFRILKFFRISILGRHTKRFHGHADGFSLTFRRMSLKKIFLGLCVSVEFIDASWEKLCFSHSLPHHSGYCRRRKVDPI